MEEGWLDEELAGCRLGDGRLDRRLRHLVECMGAGLGESIPLACQDWAGTKAAYRFFSNERVSEEDILRGHFDATRYRFAASDGPILVLHDTTEFSWRRKRPEAVGFTTTVNSRQGQGGSRPLAHSLRAADAFEPGGDDGRTALVRIGEATSDDPTERQTSRGAYFAAVIPSQDALRKGMPVKS